MISVRSLCIASLLVVFGFHAALQNPVDFQINEEILNAIVAAPEDDNVESRKNPPPGKTYQWSDDVPECCKNKFIGLWGNENGTQIRWPCVNGKQKCVGGSRQTIDEWAIDCLHWEGLCYGGFFFKTVDMDDATR